MTKSIQVSEKLHQRLKLEAVEKGIGLRELIEERLS
jgi:predicted HicB family RNase H-like nuclease